MALSPPQELRGDGPEARVCLVRPRGRLAPGLGGVGPAHRAPLAVATVLQAAGVLGLPGAG